MLVRFIMILPFLFPMVAASSGCSTRPVSHQVESAIIFDSPTYDVGSIPKRDRYLKLSIPFRVQGDQPVTIDSVYRSCKCTSVGEGVVGEKLFPGRQYALPVTIDVGQSTALGTRIDLNSGGKLLGFVVVRAVLEDDPYAVPQTVRAEFSDPGDAAPSGEFVVIRKRSASGRPLEPAESTVRGKGIEARLLRNDPVEEKRMDALTPGFVMDRLIWRWTTISGVRDYVDESLVIPWKDGDLTPASIHFNVTKAPLLKGVVENLRCGPLRAGERWSYTMVLRESGSRRPKIASIRGADDSVSTTVKEVGDKLTLVKFSVTAPAKSGEFKTFADIVFADHSIPPLRVPITGSVAP